jgi:hypothetical protein
MARAVDITARIASLERALVRAKALPADTIFDSKPMTELASVSWVSLKEWCDAIPEFDGSDCFVRGGQGIAWEFKPVKTIETLLAHFKGERERRTDRNREVAKQVGLSSHDPAPIELGELTKQVDLTLKLTDAKEKQKGYIPAALFSDFMVRYNSAAVQGVLGVKVQVDPTGSLPPDISEQMDEKLRGVAAAMHKVCEDCIREFDARLVESGNRGDGALTGI